MTSTLVGQHLVELPERYDQLATELNEKFVAAYGSVPDEPALCLVTGMPRNDLRLSIFRSSRRAELVLLLAGTLLRAGVPVAGGDHFGRRVGECTAHVANLEGNG
eukprot:COSAG02_NODE_1046_length_14984_cov_12.231844_8_plen_105_part_00